MDATEHIKVVSVEELAELMQELNAAASQLHKSICKGLRFGDSDINPATGVSNFEEIQAEANDVVAMLEILSFEMGFKNIFNREAINKKKEKVRHFMEYARKNKVLE